MRFELPAEPFKRWLEKYRATLRIETDRELAWAVGLGERTVGDVLRGKSQSIRFNTVDQAITTALAEVAVDGVQIFWVGDLYELDGWEPDVPRS